MLNIMVNDKGKMSIHVMGEPMQLCSQTMLVVGNVYEAIKEDDEVGAECFKQAFIHEIESCFMSEEELKEHALNKIKKTIEENEDLKNAGITSEFVAMLFGLK